eukprot:gnl/MRDRNA2_/MRDRNA2_112009_c0_seq1.p1 gnl/MRDRNA2_/MRDRNA2_112009_c0~~gnl/MRDRNA2_/MRDRNA2_112009_c0_seq1.p1  ORF type:complete len:277 (+),score=52.85 gnl/MRDRNA2_/MRDRNA2_112009_c0_seq1:88-918(+)
MAIKFGSLDDTVRKAKKRKSDEQSKAQSSNGAGASSAANGNANGNGGGEAMVSISQAQLSLLFANCRFSLQHESHLRGSDKDQNLKLIWPKDHLLESAMLDYKEEYAELNKTLREDKKDQFTGHTHGIKPVAYFRCLICKMSEYLKSAHCAPCPMMIDTNGADYDRVMEAIQTIHLRATTYMGDPKSTEVTRCYGIHNAKEGDTECSKWIFYCGSDPELMSAFETIKETACLKPTNIQCYRDDAPMTKQAKEVKKGLQALLNDGNGKTKGKGSRRK